MTLPLVDIRAQITERSDVWLEAEAVALGKDKSVLIREIIDEWGRKRAHAYKIATKRLAANGLQADFGWHDVDDAGGSSNRLKSR